MLLENHEQSENKSLMYVPLQAQPALAVPSSFTQELVVFLWSILSNSQEPRFAFLPLLLHTHSLKQ